MKEYIIQTELSDLKVSAFLIKDHFHLQNDKRYEAPAEKVMALHNHSTYEIFFVVGALDLRMEEKTLHFEDMILVVPPMLPHYSAEFRNCHSMNFSFEPASPYAIAVFEALERKLKRGITALPIEEAEHFYLRQLIKSIDGELPREQTSHLIPLLFSHIISRLIPSPRREIPESKRYRYVNMIDTLISSNYYKPLTLNDLAEELHLCSRQVSRIMKKEYGRSLSSLIHEKRLSAACLLLRQTDMTIGEIAREVGYEYENYFYTKFKGQYGLSPLEYRNGGS